MFFCLSFYFCFSICMFFFFFNDTATTEIYTLSLHDALPIFRQSRQLLRQFRELPFTEGGCQDRKSTRLNSSHEWISYAVFCLKKKKQKPGPAVRNRHPSRTGGENILVLYLAPTSVLFVLLRDDFFF